MSAVAESAAPTLRRDIAPVSVASAASAFVELLHLKTWDFVALDQPHAYGDISIAKAACFHDEVPAAA